MHRISRLLFSNTRPPPLQLGSHRTLLSVLSPPPLRLLPRGSLSQAALQLWGQILSLLAQRQPALPPAEAVLSENRRGIFPSSTNPFPTLGVPLSEADASLKIALGHMCLVKVIITSPLYISSDSGAAKLGAGWTNIYCLGWLLLYCVPSISLGTEDKTVNGSIQRPFPHRTNILVNIPFPSLC